MTTPSELYIDESLTGREIQAHLVMASWLGYERAEQDTAETRGKEKFVSDLILSNAEANGRSGLAARLRGEQVELGATEETVFAMLSAVKQVMKDEDKRRHNPSQPMGFIIFKSQQGSDAPEAMAIVAELLDLVPRQETKATRTIRGDMVEKKSFVSLWHVDYEYKGKPRAMDSLVWKRKKMEKLIEPVVKQAVEADYFDDPEEVTKILDGSSPMWHYEALARSGTLEELLTHNGLLKAVEEKAYRESRAATAKNIQIIEERSVDSRTHELKRQRYVLYVPSLSQ